MAEELVFYQFDACPFCTYARRRLGEKGLAFKLVTVPRARSERKEVIEVSGQPAVPTMVTDEGVLTDENAIVAYVERKYGPFEEPEASWPEDPRATLEEIGSVAKEHAAILLGMSASARQKGDLDTANVLEAAAKHMADAARWTQGRAESV